MNKALDIFNTAVVTPILYVVFTTCVIVASAILFKEWSKLSPLDMVGNLCGFLTTVSGVFLLQAFKDMDVSLKNLVRIRRDTTQALSSTSINHLDNGTSIDYTRLEEASASLLDQMESERRRELGFDTENEEDIPVIHHTR